MSLPKWVTDMEVGLNFSISQRRNLVEALSIAWEALEKKHECSCEICGGEPCSYIARNAMRRIEELDHDCIERGCNSHGG